MLEKLITGAGIGSAMLTNKLLNLRRPLTGQVLVTKFCNMTCEMCFTYPIDSKSKMAHTSEPTLEQLTDVINQLCDLGAQVIVPFGGEPLIRKDIGAIIDVIKARNRYCVLYTNGTYLPKRIDDLHGVDQLVISIDGDEETHDSIRGKGSYKNAITAVELALERNFSLRVHTVLTKQTLNTLPHMAALSRKYDVMLNYGYTDATALTLPIASKFVPSGEEVIDFLQEYLRHKKSGVRISTPASVISRCIKIIESWPIDGHTMSNDDARQNKHLNIPKCGLKFSNHYIDSDGSAFPCLPLWGKETAPNVYDVGVQKAWEHYDDLPCHNCKSVFTIEKGLFYTASVLHLLEFLEGYNFLRRRNNAMGQP